MGAAHVVPGKSLWRFLDKLQTCDTLAFIQNDRLAYAVRNHLYIVNALGQQVLEARIPVPSTFESLAFIGLSDDLTRLAISALAKKPFVAGWPYYNKVLVYDLVSGRIVFQHILPQGSRAAAFSPDGHQLATVEQGVLVLRPVP